MHVSYYDASNHSLLYARDDGSPNWFKNTIDGSGAAGCFSAIAVNPLTNDPVVTLVKGTSLYYSTYNSGSGTWQAPVLVDSGIDITAVSYQHFAMAVLSDGSLVFAYIKGSNLICVIRNDTSLLSISIDDLVSEHLALAVDSSNHPHILYYRNGNYKHAYNPGTGWYKETVVFGGNYYGAALATGPSGQVAAALLGPVGSDLYFTTRTSECDTGGSQCVWSQPELADDKCEEYFSLALDQRGNPHMACFTDSYNLHYITRVNNAWAVQTVDTNGTVGAFPALALSSSGRPRISYQDFTNKDLKYALALDKVYLPALRK